MDHAGPTSPLHEPFIEPSPDLVGNVPHGVDRGLWVLDAYGYAYASGRDQDRGLDVLRLDLPGLPLP